jgi:hypothetical protein
LKLIVIIIKSRNNNNKNKEKSIMSVKSLASQLDKVGISYAVGQHGKTSTRNIGVVAVAKALDNSALRNRPRPPRNHPLLRPSLPNNTQPALQTALKGPKFSTTCLAISVAVMSLVTSLGIWYVNTQTQQKPNKS